MIPNAVVHVPTLEELDLFKVFCRTHNLRWCTGDEFDRDTHWGNYGTQTCYFIESERIEFSDLAFATKDYWQNDRFADQRPTDPRLRLCTVETLIAIVEGRDIEEDNFDASILDDLLGGAQ